MLLTPPPVTNCHTFSDPLPLEHDVLYGRLLIGACVSTCRSLCQIHNSNNTVSIYWTISHIYSPYLHEFVESYCCVQVYILWETKFNGNYRKVDPKMFSCICP